MPPRPATQDTPLPPGSEPRDAKDLEAYVETPEDRAPDAFAQQLRLREMQQQQRQGLEQRQRRQERQQQRQLGQASLTAPTTPASTDGAARVMDGPMAAHVGPATGGGGRVRGEQPGDCFC